MGEVIIWMVCRAPVSVLEGQINSALSSGHALHFPGAHGAVACVLAIGDAKISKQVNLLSVLTLILRL